MKNIQLPFEPLKDEVFVTAKTFKGEYPHIIVSNLGRCYNLNTKRFVGSVDDKGYTLVGLPNGEHTMILRLMLMSFDVPIHEKLKQYPLYDIVADHIDGEPTHNTLDNARWLYRPDNMHTPEAMSKRITDEYRKKVSESLKGKYTGEKHPMWGKHRTEETKKKISDAKIGKKLTEEHRLKLSDAKKGKNGKDCNRSRPVLQYTKSGEFIREWSCAMDVKRELGIGNTHISQCCRGKLKSTGGFVWKYKVA